MGSGDCSVLEVLPNRSNRFSTTFHRHGSAAMTDGEQKFYSNMEQNEIGHA